MFIHPNAFKMIKQERYQDRIPVFLTNFFLQQQSPFLIMHIFAFIKKSHLYISSQINLPDATASYCAGTDRGVKGDQVNKGD